MTTRENGQVVNAVRLCLIKPRSSSSSWLGRTKSIVEGGGIKCISLGIVENPWRISSVCMHEIKFARSRWHFVHMCSHATCMHALSSTWRQGYHPVIKF
jgi:hypothetical protein